MIRISTREDEAPDDYIKGEYVEHPDGSFEITKRGDYYVDSEGRFYFVNLGREGGLQKRRPHQYAISRDMPDHPGIYTQEFVNNLLEKNRHEDGAIPYIARYRPDLLHSSLDKLEQGDWSDLALHASSFFTRDMIEKYGDKFHRSYHNGQNVWPTLAKYGPDLFTKEIIEKYIKPTDAINMEALSYLASFNGAPELFDAELLDKIIDSTNAKSYFYGNPSTGSFLGHLSVQRPELFTDKVMESHINGRSVASTLPRGHLGLLAAKNLDFFQKYKDKFTPEDWTRWIENATSSDGKEVSPLPLTREDIEKNETRLELSFWKRLIKFDKDALKKFGGSVGPQVWQQFARMMPEVFTEDVLFNWGQNFPTSVISHLANKRGKELFSPKVLGKLKNRFNPEIWKKLYSLGLVPVEEYMEAVSPGTEKTVSVSEYDYVLIRKVEKFMADKGIQQITSRELNELGIRNNPIISEALKNKNGQPLTINDIESALKKTEFYQIQGTYEDSESQSVEELSASPRHTYVLGIKNVDGLSENSKRFLDEEMKTHQIGFSDSNEFGFILYKEIFPNGGDSGISGILDGEYGFDEDDEDAKDDELVMDPDRGEMAIYIEEIQSDMARHIPKLFALVKSENQQELTSGLKEMDRLKASYGGEAGLKQVSNELSKLTKNYVRILLNAFLKRFRGVDVYISSAETMEEDANLNPIVAKKIYDEIPRQFGFTENERIPWALKLENARIDYRHIIKMSSREQ